MRKVILLLTILTGLSLNAEKGVPKHITRYYNNFYGVCRNNGVKYWGYNYNQSTLTIMFDDKQEYNAVVPESFLNKIPKRGKKLSSEDCKNIKQNLFI